jgi:competence ComEA-like helix-hairpin-helix protein
MKEVERHEMERAVSTLRIPPVIVLFLTLPILLFSCARLPQRSATANDETSSVTASPETLKNDRVNINTASAVELEKLPGIGKILAERIVAHRERYGPFRRAEHLMMVRGFSDNKFRKIRYLVTVE